MLHHITQRGQVPIMHVGRGLRDIAQSRYFKLLKCLRGQIDVARRLPRRFSFVVVVGTQQIETAGAQLLDALITPPINAARFAHNRNTDLVKLAVGELGPEVTQAAIAFADK